MKGIAFWFFAAGIVSVVIGMVWGIAMGISGDHLLSPAHAHLNLLGWVTFAIFAFYYHLVPAAAEGALPRLHFALAVLGLVVIVPGITFSIREASEAVAATGSVISLLSMLCFLAVVVRYALRSEPA